MNISVEYAHIYTHQHVNEEHELSLSVLGEVLEGIKNDGNSASLVVMVDDYSFPDPSFDYSSFASSLEGEGYKPDLIIRESQLIPVCDEVLKLLKNQKLNTELTDYIKAKKKYPCSLFIAAWYLLRLGQIESQLLPAELKAGALINILPESFKPFEDKAIEIIKDAGFEDRIGDLNYKFLAGRLIA